MSEEKKNNLLFVGMLVAIIFLAFFLTIIFDVVHAVDIVKHPESEVVSKETEECKEGLTTIVVPGPNGMLITQPVPFDECE